MTRRRCYARPMNYLAHLHLAGPHAEARLGGLYGDFVKGPLDGRWPAGIEAGIRLHRQIDAFTDSHPLVLQARARLPAPHRRTAGILVDLFFDHCLARHWSRYADQPLGQFTAEVYHLLLQQKALPGRLQSIAPRMASDDWLGSYQHFDTLAQVLDGMQRRLSRPLPLREGFAQLESLYAPLTADFAAFYPLLQRFAAGNHVS